LLDGAKSLYTEILSLVEGRLRPGAFIVADNTDSSPEYVAHVRSPENGYLSMPFRADVELSTRIGLKSISSADTPNKTSVKTVKNCRADYRGEKVSKGIIQQARDQTAGRT
jgi:hypothetical protein